MELLKSKVIIDEKYKPSLNNEYIDYFNRALVFAQTNYQEQLDKIAKAHFRRIAPTAFFEEYVWCLSCVDTKPEIVSLFFPELSKSLAPFYNSFWDLNNFPQADSLKERIVSMNHNEKKFDQLYQCANVINRGIKLFGWDEYKNNFLSSPERLCVLPGIGIVGARHLARNTGISGEVISSAQLQRLAVHWGFEDCSSLCAAIQRNVALQPKVIEMVLWYAAHTFETK
jgi:hypothetical protein